MRNTQGAEAAGVDGGGALCKVHDRRALVLDDLLVRVQADEQRGAQAACLQHDAGVAMVEEVEAAVDPEALLVYGDGQRWG
jgi:hypothetical protein